MTQVRKDIHDARIGRVVSLGKHIASGFARIGADYTIRNTDKITVQMPCIGFRYRYRRVQVEGWGVFFLEK
jgi:hypothetical protein